MNLSKLKRMLLTHIGRCASSTNAMLPMTLRAVLLGSILTLWSQPAEAMEPTMGLLEILKGQSKPNKSAPEWASFMTGPEHEKFVKLVQEEFRRRKIEFVFNDRDGVIEVKKAKVGKPARDYGLVTLAQRCKQADSKEWPTLISSHLDQADRLLADAEALDSTEHDYSKIESLLRVRLYPPIWGDEEVESHVWREDLPGLRTALCFDLPSALRPVKKVIAAQWKVPLETAWRAGIANSLKDKSLKAEQVQIHPGMFVTAVTGDEIWTSVNVLKASEFIGTPSKYGVLVAVPHRHLVLLHNITGGDVPGFIRAMGNMAHGIDKEGPGSISPNLYWLIDGAFQVAPVTVDGKIDVKMPMPAFAERVLKPLGLSN